jgi:hypothetical protein
MYFSPLILLPFDPPSFDPPLVMSAVSGVLFFRVVRAAVAIDPIATV